MATEQVEENNTVRYICVRHYEHEDVNSPRLTVVVAVFYFHYVAGRKHQETH